MLSEPRGDAATSSQASGRGPDLDLRAPFAGLENVRSIVLAVSGGPDSMALLLLVSRWASQLGSTAPHLHVATVDHGLRPDSAVEADIVARAAEAMDLPHRTLVWDGPKPTTRIQERARSARYDLLSEYARLVGATHVLTAHHADDQAETVLLRLLSGSGLTGLSGMRREIILSSGVHLVRPLLSLTKAELISVCRSEGQIFIDDPSNENPVFARAQLRAQSGALVKLGLDRTTLVRLSHRLARADAALEAETDRWMALLSPSHDDVCRANISPLRDAQSEIWVRVLQRVVTSMASGDHRMRLDRLETLAGAMQNALSRGKCHYATLAGTRLRLRADGTLLIEREAPRRRGGKQVLRPN